jgi:fructose-specific component phosphotransferase system IIB-like protein
MKKNDDALNNPRVHLVRMNPATLNPFKRIAGAQSTAREYGAGVRAQFFNSHRSAGLQARGQYQCKV